MIASLTLPLPRSLLPAGHLLPRTFRSFLSPKGGSLPGSCPQPVTLRSVVGARGNMSTLEELSFDNRALKRLPLDAENGNYVRSVAGKGVV